MRRRVRYDWKITDFIYSFLGVFSHIFHCWINKKNKLNIKTRLEVFHKGKIKFSKEFDAVNFARSIRNLKTLVSSLMDDSEKFMIPYQKCNSISLYSDTSSEWRDQNYDEVPKLFSKSSEKIYHEHRIDKFIVLNYTHN